MVLDLVSNYDLDGLLLDYFRYPVADSGYNQYAIERYNSEFGLSGQPAPDDAQFQQWRRRQLSDWLRVIYAEVMDVRPGLKLLAAVSQDGDHPFAAHYQDWTAWLAEKNLDGFLPMNYTTDNLVFAARSGAANLAKGDRHCYMGQGSYLNPKENTFVQLETARLEGSEGLATYSYRNTNNAGDSPAVFYQHLKDNVFTAPDPIPAMEWKDSPVSGIIFGGVSAAGGGEGRGYTTPWWRSPGALGPSGPTPGGGYALIDIAGGTYSLIASAPGYQNRLVTSVNLSAGEVVTVDFELEPELTPQPTPVSTPEPTPSATSTSTPSATPSPTSTPSPTPGLSPLPTPRIHPHADGH